MKQLLFLIVIFAVLPFTLAAQQENGQQVDTEVKLELLMDSAADSVYLYVVNDVFFIHDLDPGKVLESIDHGSIVMIAIYNKNEQNKLFTAYVDKTGNFSSIIQAVIVLETLKDLLPTALSRESPSFN